MALEIAATIACRGGSGNPRLRSDVIGHVKIAPMAGAGRDPSARFSDRADDYVKYRPHYSPEVAQALQEACGLRSQHLIADVGCGTGLLAKILLDNGNRVIGVEPNREMRVAGADYLAAYPNFNMVDGSAEATTLPGSSVDFVVAGQAFHWFRPDETRIEFARILKPRGWAVLVWHDRNVDSTPFLRAYEDFVRRHSVDYEQVTHKHLARYEAMLRDLPQLFCSHASGGRVVLQYDTKIYFGHLDR